MIFAVLGDMRGNFSACDAVLAYLEEEAIHAVFQTGNFAVGGTGGPEIIAALREKDAYCVQGNDERMLTRLEKKRSGLALRLEEEKLRALESAAQLCRLDDLEFLRNLPHMQHVTLEDISIALCHGSPSSQQKILDEDTPLPRFEREREIANARILLLGGAEKAFHVWVAGTLLLCPGVCTAENGAALFTLVNTEEEPWEVEEIELYQEE